MTLPGRETGTAVPCLTVLDADKSIKFYEKAFGFKVIADEILKTGGKTVHAGMSFEDRPVVMISPENDFMPEMKSPATTKTTPPVIFYIYCADIDTFTEAARVAEATVLAEPADMFWGDRKADFADPDGYRWTFATNTGGVDLSKAPEGFGTG